MIYPLFKMRFIPNYGICVSAIEIHDRIDSGTQFTKWFDRIVRPHYTQGKDYIFLKEEKTTKNPRNNKTYFQNYYIKPLVAIQILMKRKDNKDMATILLNSIGNITSMNLEIPQSSSISRIFACFNFKSVQTFYVNNSLMFDAYEISKILGYKDTEKAIQTHCIIQDPSEYIYSSFIKIHGNSNGILIGERNIYRLILGSNHQNTKEFKAYITDIILPSIIRNNGNLIVENGCKEAIPIR